MKLVQIVVDANVTVKVGEEPMAWQEANLLTYDKISVPVAVNTEAVLKDEELLLYLEKPPKPQKPKAASKANSWRAEAKRMAKKPRT
eukprot:643146-Alexandrium_andersonii.AAC.1